MAAMIALPFAVAAFTEPQRDPAASAAPPADVFGHIRGGRLELQDRADKFWLSATAHGSRLDGRLAGGSHNRARAMSIPFTRVERHP